MRYLIGIDLGTTNCALSYVDLLDKSRKLQFFAVPQHIAAGRIDKRSTLPSFTYLLAENEQTDREKKLPWQSLHSGQASDSLIGAYALELGTKTPTKLIASAKSWLCSHSSNKFDKILPLTEADQSRRLSPVEVSTKYLAHLKNAFNHIVAKGDPDSLLEEQEVTITVPASFDEVARALTVEAIKSAGIRNFMLLEEPQAAFYSWISNHESSWRSRFKAGDKILICDIGGGTTDFSIIEIKQDESALFFERMRVGDHLLLGGDNIDIAIAHFLEQKLKAKYSTVSLHTHQWQQLLAQSREAKELLLGNTEVSQYAVNIYGLGSSLIKDSISLQIGKDELQKFVLDGFFPIVDYDIAVQRSYISAIRQSGLQYESEPAITKHLARFLAGGGLSITARAVDYILFNGGVTKSSVIQNAILNNLSSWFPEKSIQTLQSQSLDLSVAHGAAYYCLAKRGEAEYVKSGFSKTYYIEILEKTASEPIKKALTILPRGTKEGHKFRLDKQFMAKANMPISFQLLSSSVRISDKIGQIVTIDESEIQPLAPMQTILAFGKAANRAEVDLPVQIEAEFTAIGTLEVNLKAINSDHKWALQFQLKSSLGQTKELGCRDNSSLDKLFTADFLKPALILIEQLFQTGENEKKIMAQLEDQLEIKKMEWPLSVLRTLFDKVIDLKPVSGKSEKLEARWWNLVGFFLRPGYGYSLDDYRINKCWKIILAELKNSSFTVEVQKVIALRRIAMGFSSGMQTQIFDYISKDIYDKNKNKLAPKTREDPYLYKEKLRLIANLERLSLKCKLKLGESLLTKILQDKYLTLEPWVLGRLAGRRLMQASYAQTISASTCEKWVEKVLQAKLAKNCHIKSMLLQMCRKASEREVNVSNELLTKVQSYIGDELNSETLWIDSQTSAAEASELFGEQLPVGLSFEA